MSIYVASTQAFIDLFASGIISQQALEEVYQQTRHLEDNEDISNGIYAWLQSQNNSQLLQAYQDKFNQLTSASSPNLVQGIGPGNTKSQTKPGESNPTSRELLDNIITENKPLNDDSSSQSKPS